MAQRLSTVCTMFRRDRAWHGTQPPLEQMDIRTLIDDAARDDRRRQLHPARTSPPSAGCSAGRRRRRGAGRSDRPGHRPDVRARPATTRGARGPGRAGRPGRPQRRSGWRASATTSSRPTARTASRSSSPTWPRWPRSGPPSSGSSRPRRASTSLVDNAGADLPGADATVPTASRPRLATMVVGPFALVGGPAAAPRADARLAGHRGHLGRHVHAAPRPRRPAGTGQPFDGTRAYARAKRAQVALVREWARRLTAASVTFYAMHPGWADTPGLADFPARLLSGHGAAASLTRPRAPTRSSGWRRIRPPLGADGQLYLDRRPRPFDRVPATRLSAAERRRLWSLVVGLAGVADPLPDPAA